MKKIAIVVAILACVAGISFAETPALMKGGWELGLDAGWDFEGPDGQDVGLDAWLGYFIMDNLSVGVDLSFAYADDANDFYLGVYGEYNFDMGWVVVPHVGVGIGWLNREIGLVTDDNNAFNIGAWVGIKYFVTETWALDLDLYFDYATEKVYLNDDKLEETNFGLSLGIENYF